ncbi:MAG: baseplate J/gp47 family protein [Anaerolineae bacterium]
MLGVAAFIVPSAEVRLTPAQEPLSETITLTARSDVQAASASQLTLPARRIGQSVEVDGTVLATGTEFAPDQAAQGAVVFTNRRDEAQEIPPGTIVATSTGSNISFETIQPVTLPPGVGSQVTAPIQALEPGPSGNVRAFTINTIEGSLGVTANVINPSGTSGGNVKEVPVVQQADKDALRAQLELEARQKAYIALGELLREGEFVPSETVGTLVLDETYDRFTDEAADEVTLRLRLLATALAVDGAAADEMALQAMGQKIPRRGQMLTDSVRFSRGPATVTQEGDVVVISFPNTASSVVVLDVDPAAVRAAIRGMTPEDAVATLQRTWRLQGAPELALGPQWIEPVLRRLDFDWLPLPVAGRVPWLPFRTHVNVQFAASQLATPDTP